MTPSAFTSRRRPARRAHFGAVAAACALVSAGGVPAPAIASAHHRHRPHSQALQGSLKAARVKVVRVGLSGGRGGTGDPGDDYPAALKNRPQDSVLDQWREYNRECTSFVAWALSSRNGFTIPFYDNANNWGPRAQVLGYAVNATPAAGSVAWSRSGHVAYVESVSGGNVNVEEYNHDLHGNYDARTLPASHFTGYIHFADVQADSQPPAAPIPAPTPTPVPAPTAPSTPAPEGARTYSEQETPSHPVNTFTNYHNASGLGQAVGAGEAVQVSCKVHDPTIQSVNPDGYWYRIASSPWNNAYYAPANTFMNGDPYGGPYTHNTDFSVPDC